MTVKPDFVEEVNRAKQKWQSMCGYCIYWHRQPIERCHGKRMGVCSMTGRTMERCAWCTVWKVPEEDQAAQDAAQ